MSECPPPGHRDVPPRFSRRAGAVLLTGMLVLGVSPELVACDGSGSSIRGIVLGVKKTGGLPTFRETEIPIGPQECITEPAPKATGKYAFQGAPVTICSQPKEEENIPTTTPVIWEATVYDCDSQGQNCTPIDVVVSWQYAYLPGSCYPAPGYCDCSTPTPSTSGRTPTASSLPVFTLMAGGILSA